MTTAGHPNPQVPVDVTPASGCWVLLDPKGRGAGLRRATVPMRHVGCDSSSPNPPPTVKR